MKSVAAAVFGLWALAAGDAAAETYAAIAFAQGSGNYGYWHRASSRAAAEEGALQECGPGCSVVIWTRDACAVLAVGDDNGYGSYWSTSEDDAVSGALGQCENNTSNCELTVMTCSAY